MAAFFVSTFNNQGENMLRIKDAKSNDFAAFDSLEPAQTKNAVKAAFKYIVSLSNVSRVYIDDWNAEIFKVDGRWVTDKNQINKIFFERATHVSQSSLDPMVAKAVAQSIANVTKNRIQNITNNIRTLDGEIRSHQSMIHEKLQRMFQLKAEEAAFLRHNKEIGAEGLANVEKLFNSHAVELWDLGEEYIEIICKTDTIITHRDLPNKIHRRFNLGRLIFKIKTSDMNISIKRRDREVNRWAYKNSCHPHYGNYLCWGGFDADRIKASKDFDFEALVGVLMRWKDTYDSRSALTSISSFNHHPAFTEYLEGDFLFGKTESEMAIELRRTYFCPPFVGMSDAIKRYPNEFIIVDTDRYFFKEGGGPVDGHKYELDRPADKPRYMAAMPPLNEEEYRQWLIDHGHMEDNQDGYYPPTPLCGADVELRWSTLEGDYVLSDDFEPEDPSEEEEY